jgi:hypothetical protein
MLKDKIERLESRGEKNQFFWILGHCGLKVNEKADSEAKQSIREGRDSQLLLPVSVLPSGKRKAKRCITVSVKTQKGQEKATLKGTTGIAHVHGSAR